jgi:hypothetical protein
MKKAQIKVGRTYYAKVSNRVVPVRIVKESLYGGWHAINEETGRAVLIKSAQRLRAEAGPQGLRNMFKL